MRGTLYVIATPIGNLEDLSPRALRILRSVELIACEDTRRTAKLLARFGVEARTLSCHRFNERERLEPVLQILRDGGSVALVSDGGTPAISDPGALLVQQVLEEGIALSPVPGPSAIAALLSASGLPADRYVFDGFLPHRPGERRRRLRELRDEPRTVVVFEAPHRIRRTLRDLAEVMGDRPLVLGRELTKQHETILRGTAREIEAALGEGEGDVKGEITLAIAGAEAAARDRPPAEEGAGRALAAWRAALEATSGSEREALRLAARALHMKRPDLYRLLVELGALDR